MPITTADPSLNQGNQYTAQQVANQQATQAIDAANAQDPGNIGNQLAAKLKADPNFTYQNVGAANVGGYTGGAQDLQDSGLAGMAQNDVQQAQNAAALQNSIANMQTNGAQNVQNPYLAATAAQGRNDQLGALAALQSQANGGAPSAAAYNTRGAIDAAGAANAGMMGSAHGLSALTGAQSGGVMASNSMGAAGAGATAAQAQTTAGLTGLGSGATNLRQNDLTALQNSDQSALFNSSQANSWKLGQANLAATQGALGNAQSQSDQNWYTAAMDPTYRQLSYDQQMNAIANGQSASQAAADFAAQQSNQQAEQGLIAGGVQAGMTAAGSLAGPAGTAAGAAAGGMAGSALGKYLT